MRPRAGWLLRFLGALVGIALPMATAVGIPAPATAAGGLTAAFTRSQDWGGGFELDFTVTNGSAVTVGSWTISFDLPASEQVQSAWNGTLQKAGNHYAISSPPWEPPLPAGGSATPVGMNVSRSSGFVPPANCLVNGNPCAGGGGGQAPGAPTGLAVVAMTTSSVTLSWTAPAVTGAGLAGYRVLERSTVAATTSIARATVGGLAAGSTHTYAVVALDVDGNQSATSAPVTVTVPATGPPPGSVFAAPYVDMGAFPTPSLTQFAQRTRLNAFSLGFIVNGTGGCQATWFNAFSMSQGFARDDIGAILSSGGEVKPSFGGEAGSELAQSCTDVTALTAQYQSVVDAYGFDYIDFDIEGAAVADPTSVDRRSAAMAALQARARARGQALRISLTLPVLPSGLPDAELNVIGSAIRHGVDVTEVNVMTMDFGDATAPSPAGRMGRYSIQAAQSTHDQLVRLYPGRSSAQVWAMIGVTPMIGVNDQQDEVFTQTDMNQLLAFARQVHLGQLAFWEVGRDANACTGALFKCTNVPQKPFDFSRIIAGYRG
jgi:hypothetical protein